MYLRYTNGNHLKLSKISKTALITYKIIIKKSLKSCFLFWFFLLLFINQLINWSPYQNDQTLHYFQDFNHLNASSNTGMIKEIFKKA